MSNLVWRCHECQNVSLEVRYPGRIGRIGIVRHSFCPPCARFTIQVVELADPDNSVVPSPSPSSN